MLVSSLGRLALSVTQPHAGRKRGCEFCKREARGRASSKTAKQGTRSSRRPCRNTTGTADRFRSSVGVAQCSPARPARHDPWGRPEKRIGTRDIVICHPGSHLRRGTRFGRGRGPARTDDSLGGVRRRGGMTSSRRPTNNWSSNWCRSSAGDRSARGRREAVFAVGRPWTDSAIVGA